MFENLVVTQPSDDIWLTRLRRGDFLWLAKEKQFGIIEWKYKSEIGFSSGRIGFRKYDSLWKSETWIVRPNGKGIDFSQLFLPVEDDVSQENLTLPETEIKKLARLLSVLMQRVERLESQVGLKSPPLIVEETKLCAHASCVVKFDPEAASTMTTVEVRKNFPRFFGLCPECEEQVIIYASRKHFVMGDW